MPARQIVEAVVGEPSGLYRARVGEYIVAAAVKDARGDVYLGDTHLEAAKLTGNEDLRGHILSGAWREFPAGWADGFYTNRGNFLDRHQALALAKKNQQLIKPQSYHVDVGLDAHDVKGNQL